MTPTPDNIRNALEAHRIRKGLSWAEVARELGVSTMALRRVLRRWRVGTAVDLGLDLALLLWLPVTGDCPHDGQVYTGGTGTRAEPPRLRTVCLQCGAEVHERELALVP